MDLDIAHPESITINKETAGFSPHRFIKLIKFFLFIHFLLITPDTAGFYKL